MLCFRRRLDSQWLNRISREIQTQTLKQDRIHPQARSKKRLYGVTKVEAGGAKSSRVP